MSDEFYRTAMGRKFYDITLPRIADGLERLATAAERVAAALERRHPNSGPGNDTDPTPAAPPTSRTAE
jgi:hypothetical protein